MDLLNSYSQMLYLIVTLGWLKKAGNFPDGPVAKNPPANAGDMGSIPGLARSHMPQSC